MLSPLGNHSAAPKAFSSLADLENRIANHSFIRSRWFAQWREHAKDEIAIGWLKATTLAIKALWNGDGGKWAQRQELKRILADSEAFRKSTNAGITGAVLHNYAPYFDSIEEHPLTLSQRQAVVSDEDATLVIAGAGTGKTSTILAKIGLLLKTGQCRPEEILAISFTRKSATELGERVELKLGVELDIHTFHKLGLNIVGQAGGRKPRLAPFLDDPLAKAKHLDRIVQGLRENADFAERLIDFMAFNQFPEMQAWNFVSLAEYRSWLRANNVMSLDGVAKKSLEECLIANWLLLHGVPFVYEDPYEHDTRTPERRQYCPDFHLTGTNIYIEHFGVDEDDLPAPYIDAQEYQRGMAWKRGIHLEKETKLIETFSWQHGNGSLLSKLEQNLTALGCKFNPISDTEALHLLNKSGAYTSFGKLLGTFLTLYKGNGSRLNDPSFRTSGHSHGRERAFLEIFDSVLQEYENRNRDAGQIDFEDMISQAIQLVQTGAWKSGYRYILVDEFQDISPGRAELVRTLQVSHPDCALFCVGDDWQSIYRFAGSDIGAMTRFESIFGPTCRVPLDTTFRFDNFAITTSSRFVLKNPAQIRKDLKAVKREATPSVVLYKLRNDESRLEWALSEIVKESSANANVLILERYNFGLPDEAQVKSLQRRFPGITIGAMSVHAAKGLEADYVIVGLRGGEWGFPATKADDPLLAMVLTQADEYQYGEERRLFYVALTRARRKTYLVCDTGSQLSSFAAELDREKTDYQIEVLGKDTEKMVCEKCKSGTMVLHEGPHGKFYRCSNHPLCKNTRRTCPDCGIGLMVKGSGPERECSHCDNKLKPCPRCGTGFLIRRNGPSGSFFGCTNYSDHVINCKYTAATTE